MNNIAGISVATSANNNNQNNNIETLKGMIIAGHDGAKDFGSGEYGLTFGFNWGEYNIFVSRTYGMWLVSLYKNYKSEWTSEGRKISYDAQILDRRLGDYARGKRWSMSLAENMAKFILDTIANYEQEQEENRIERMNEVIAEAQESINTIMTDLEASVSSFDNIETKVDAFVAKMALKRVMEICEQCIKDCGEITECEMVWDDGYHVDLSEVAKWYGTYNIYWDFTSADLEDLMEALGNMTCIDSDMPLGIDKETLDFELGGYEDETSFLGLVADYPSYIWDELRDFISTYYHYAYCA